MSRNKVSPSRSSRPFLSSTSVAISHPATRQQHAAPTRNTTRRPPGNRIIDRALGAARIDLLPRPEQERVRQLCLAAVGTEQNAGKITRIVQDLVQKEVEAGLQENRKVQAAITAKVRNADQFFEDLRARFADPSGKQVPHGLRPEDKCAHGCYIPEFYCGFCRDGRENDPGYDVQAYTKPARRGLAHAVHILSLTSEGRECLDDLRQECAIEIWRAWKRRGGDMTAGLAYKIARDVGSAFLKQRIDETEIRVCDAEGTPILDERGKALGLDGGELQRRSEDESLSKAEREAARTLLNEYQATKPRLEPFIPEDSEEVDESESNYHNPSTDAKLYRGQDVRAVENALAASIDTQRELQELRRLAETWHGSQRAVGEAGGTGSRWNPPCDIAFLELQIGSMRQGGNEHTGEDHTDVIPEHGYTPRSLSKTALHSSSHAFPLFALRKSTPSSLAISSNDRLGQSAA